MPGLPEQRRPLEDNEMDGRNLASFQAKMARTILFMQLASCST
jgi:hypothetical protein